MSALSAVMIRVEEAIGGPVAVIHAYDHARDLGFVDVGVRSLARPVQEADISAVSQRSFVSANASVKTRFAALSPSEEWQVE
jgi:hypothetical protein